MVPVHVVPGARRIGTLGWRWGKEVSWVAGVEVGEGEEGWSAGVEEAGDKRLGEDEVPT